MMMIPSGFHENVQYFTVNLICRPLRSKSLYRVSFPQNASSREKTWTTENVRKNLNEFQLCRHQYSISYSLSIKISIKMQFVS